MTSVTRRGPWRRVTTVLARAAVVLGVLFLACVGVAGAAPVGQISEFAGGLNPAGS